MMIPQSVLETVDAKECVVLKKTKAEENLMADKSLPEIGV